MSNLFSGVTIYAQKWEVKDEVALDAVSIQILGRPGDKDIMRAKINAL